MKKGDLNMNEGLLSFYTNAILHNKGFAQLGRIRKCVESSPLDRTQRDTALELITLEEYKIYALVKFIADARL